MPSDRFERILHTTATSSEAWDVLTDPPLLASWVPVMNDVVEHERLRRYSATLTDRIGIFTLSAPLEIAVVGLTEGSFIAIEGEGRDRQVDSRVVFEGSVRLAGSNGGTTLTVLGRYSVTGRAATLGRSVIRARSEDIVDRFCEGLQRHLR